jgi:hypothetical protein
VRYADHSWRFKNSRRLCAYQTENPIQSLISTQLAHNVGTRKSHPGLVRMASLSGNIVACACGLQKMGSGARKNSINRRFPETIHFSYYGLEFRT